MVRPASARSDWWASFERASDSGGVEDLASWLGANPASNESELADVIDADGRFRFGRGLETPLERYLEAAPGLDRMPVALDAAIEATLRWMCSSGRSEEEAVASLVDSYPDLGGAIVDAVTLNRGVWSTRWLIDRIGAPVARELPCDIGPVMEDGQARYRLKEVLGRGSCGEVYLGIDRRLSEAGHEAQVAVKLLDARGTREDVRRRFLNEAMRARRVDHPSVVRVLDRGEMDDGVLFIVYERVRGETLARWLRAHGGKVGAREAAGIVASVARGVQAAHGAGLIHCDLHPTNVLIDDEGRARICDFGISVLSDELEAGAGLGAWGGRALGSLAFIPPEQFGLEERAFGAAADVYALGGLLHFLVTGDLPNGLNGEEIRELFGRGDGAAVRLRGRGIDGLDRDLNAIRLRALATAPEDRHGSASALADDLESWIRLRPIEWAHPSVARRATLFVRRRPVVAVLSLVAMAALIIGASAMSYTVGVVHSRKQGLLRWFDGFRAERAAIRGESDGAAVVLPIWIVDKFKADQAFGGDGLFPAVVRAEELRVLGQLVDGGYAHGGGPDPLVLFLETTEAYLMLVNREPHPEVRDVLAHNRSQWARLAPEDSRIFRELDVLDGVAIVKEQYLSSKGGRGFDEVKVHEAEEMLLRTLPIYYGWYEGSDYHKLAVRALRNLYGPLLLRDATAYEPFKRRYLEMAPNSRYPGVTPESDWKNYDQWERRYGSDVSGLAVSSSR